MILSLLIYLFHHSVKSILDVPTTWHLYAYMVEQNKSAEYLFRKHKQ